MGDIVINALHEILPHAHGVSAASIIMAYIVMIKYTLVGIELSDTEKDEAKALYDQTWSEVSDERLMPPLV